MNERDFEQVLHQLLTGSDVDGDEDLQGARVSTFEEDGILTHNRGLVVRLQNGAEFQVTIVQSQEAEGGLDEEECRTCELPQSECTCGEDGLNIYPGDVAARDTL